MFLIYFLHIFPPHTHTLNLSHTQYTHTHTHTHTHTQKHTHTHIRYHWTRYMHRQRSACRTKLVSTELNHSLQVSLDPIYAPPEKRMQPNQPSKFDVSS